ncbi:site-specific DNA-methyltransferase [Enterobacter hormaechei subsp. steigerwaltii]|uniref:site-specific DNA-methyltransferase n=1 Tax=Enterobacter hormaechei TaxID=158836 RepID=UPI003F4214B1
MNKLSPEMPELQSMNITADNITKLKSLFPEAFNEDSVDFEVLKQLLDENVDDKEERYGLNWHGKRQARQLALTPSRGTLRPCKDESVDWDNTKNLMIEGDNLEVLKLLQKSYAGKVKLIYIDPPYNTGKDFVYPDNFQDNMKNYLEITGQTEDGARLSTNTETSGRYHTDWLNMIYPRLKVAHNLLIKDGVIFISIDDSELYNLKEVCDEIFGSENFIATLIWEKGRKNDAKLISVGHEYILTYAKNKSYLLEKEVRWREAKPGAQEILDEYLKLRKKYGNDNKAVESGIRNFYESLPSNHPSKKHVRYNKVDDRGVWRDDNMSWPGGDGPKYDLIHPKTGLPCAIPEGGWRYSTLDKMLEMIKLGKVVFRDDHSEPPIRKTYLVEVDELLEDDENDSDEQNDDLPIQVAGSYFYRSALQATKELSSLFGSKVFNNPKDKETLIRWFSYVNVKSDDIILDFFAGSGSTGHAVYDLNVKEDKNIRFILVQLPETIDPKSKGVKPAIAFLNGLNKPTKISEITKERLRRAGKKVREDNPEWKGDVGFRVFKLDTSNIRPWEASAETLSEQIDAYVSPILEGRSEEDLLTELMLKRGIDLSVNIETRQFDGLTVSCVDGGKLFTCFTSQIPASCVEVLTKGIIDWHKSLKAGKDTVCYFLDDAFENNVAKTNICAILEQHGLTNLHSL